MDKLVTFFTPTYNRAHILHRCYESLCGQTSYDFKWLIIDDGSTDGTEDLVQPWIEQEKRFEIEYRYKENGGLHTTYNVAVDLVDTELFVCFESDDIFTSDAMAIIKKIWKKVRETSCVGFITLCRNPEGHLIGERYRDDIETVPFRDQAIIAKGDKQFVFRTEVLKKIFPMPVFEGEKHFDPQFQFHKLDNIGPMYVTNEVFDIVEYQPDGLTQSIIRQYYNSPNSFAEFRKLYMQLPNRSAFFVLKNCIHYVASYSLAGKLNKALKESPRKGFTILAFLPGLLWAQVIRFLNRDVQKVTDK